MPRERACNTSLLIESNLSFLPAAIASKVQKLVAEKKLDHSQRLADENTRKRQNEI